VPILAALGRTSTFDEPMKSIVARSEEMERMPGVLRVSVFGGFPYADVDDAGMSALVVTDGDRADGEVLVRELHDRLWSRRSHFVHSLVPVEEAVRRAIEAPRGPVVLADVADNPGGGGANDGVEIVRELIRQNAQDAAVAHVVDGEAARACHAAGLGAEVTLNVGAKTDDHHGRPIALTGKVTFLSDGHFRYEGPFEAGVKRCRGKTAVVKSGGVEVVLAERRLQNVDLAFFRSADIEPTERKILVVKSSVHYRAAYEPIAAAIIEVDAPGLVTPNLRRFDFRKVRRPIFPLDEV
jgi:microcystin degradation protein MlrC